MSQEKNETGLRISKQLCTFEVWDDDNNRVTRIIGTELVYIAERTLVMLGEDCMGSFHKKYNVCKEYNAQEIFVAKEITEDIIEQRSLKIKDKLTDKDDAEMQNQLAEYLLSNRESRTFTDKFVMDLLDKVANQGMGDFQENILKAFLKYTSHDI